MRSDWWKFNECLTSGTRPPVRYIRRGEEGVRASDLGSSENQASPRDMLQRHVPSCELTALRVHSFGNAQHALRHRIVEVKWRPSKENRLRMILQLKIVKVAVRFLVFPCARAQRISQFGG